MGGNIVGNGQPPDPATPLYRQDPESMPPALRRAARSTRASFFVAGFALACWAPMVPYAQVRLQADPAMLGTILLCLGLGSIVGMPLAGTLSSRLGARSIILAGTVATCLALPLLALLSSPAGLGLCLFVLGAGLGAVDVATNIHGTGVQRTAGIPMMSGFHGFYSLGGLAGASGMTALLASGVDIGLAAFVAVAVVVACMVVAVPGFLASRPDAAPSGLVMPRGVVLVIGLLMLVCFLVEGALLDWGGLLLVQAKQVDVAVSGIGYTVFALAMAPSRLVGDRVVGRIGERRTLVAGLALAGAGIALAALADPLSVVLAGIALAGAASGNVVPVLFTLAGRQTVMPTAQAITAVSIPGYLGVLMGPALIGYLAHFTGLVAAFVVLAALMLVAMVGIPAAARTRHEALGVR